LRNFRQKEGVVWKDPPDGMGGLKGREKREKFSGEEKSQKKKKKTEQERHPLKAYGSRVCPGPNKEGGKRVPSNGGGGENGKK